MRQSDRVSHNWLDQLEENLIAILLGLMTLITFANVVARYVFNSNILWALEATVFLFAWLVLLGVSYGVKHSLHLGVDFCTAKLPKKSSRMVLLLALLCCLSFSILLLKGSWDYWSVFVGKRAFLETEDIPMPDSLQFFAVWLNEGEPYEKIPRFIPYFALPLGMVLLCLRYFQLAWRYLQGGEPRVIANHVTESKSGQTG